MKGRSLIGFGVSLAILGTGSLPVFAQSQRYLTNVELQRMRQQFRQVIDSNRQNEASANYIRDRRTPAERQKIQSFVGAWSKVDPAVAPFLGSWSGYEEVSHIYPSNVKGRVCIIVTGEGSGGFSLGSVSNEQIRTPDGEVIFKQGNYLGRAIFQNNKPKLIDVIPANNPQSLEPVQRISSYISDFQVKNVIIQQFKAAGCTASPPNKR